VVTAVTDPTGLTVAIIYDGSATAPSNAGNYEVVGTVTSLGYVGSATGTLTIQPAAQTISFTSTPPAPALVGGSYPVSATGGASGNQVVFSSLTPAVCGVTGSTVGLDAAGTCTVAADQAGSTNYAAAPQATQTFMVAATAQSAIQLESTSTAMTNAPRGDASRTLSIPAPAGVIAGDLLLAQITYEKGSDAPVTGVPAGWTLVRRTDRLSDIGQAIYSRVATGAEPASYAWSFSQAVKAAGGISRYSGVDPVNPIVASSGAGGDSNTLTAPGVTAADHSMLVSFFGFKKKDTTLSVPTGMTGRYNFQNPQDVTLRAADELRESAGATGNRVSRSSPSNSDKWVAQNVVLRRAPGS
jgi:hypothetical protein